MHFLTTPTDTIAVIDGSLPDADEWARISRDDVLVNVLWMPGEDQSLTQLVPFASYISRLAVNSSTCTDLAAVERMPGLRWLLVGGVVSRAPDPAALTSLEFFGGDPAQLPGMVGLPTISRLKIRWRPGIEKAISRTTIDLTLTEAGGLSDLSGLVRLDRLESLTVHGSRSLSLRGLAALTSLQNLTLHSVKALTETSEVLEASELSSLTLEDCPAIDRMDAILDFSGQVSVVGRNPFDPEFQRAAGSRWTFPPRQGGSLRR